MYLEKLQVNNFQGFSGTSPVILFNGPNGKPGSGLNILVGENNAGKTTLLKAISWLHDYGRGKDPTISTNLPPTAELGVIGEFAGDIPSIIDSYVTEKHRNSIKNLLIPNSKNIRLRRVLNSKKDIQKEIRILQEQDNFQSPGFNKTGIDSFLRGCIDLNTIWADDNPQDEFTFSVNTLSYNLIKDVIDSFSQSQDYQLFQTAFDQYLNSPQSTLKQELQIIEQNLNQRFNDFFGGGTCALSFDRPEAKALAKGLTVNVDIGTNLPVTGHGSGLQRIAMLVFLIVWADMQSKKRAQDKNAFLEKPYAFILDEPEICMHPRGQQKLLQALLEISTFHQVFMTTHSPLFLLSTEIKNANLILCSKNANGTRTISQVNQFAKLFPWSPSWGEVSWFAYKLPTIDFQNELYGYLQQLWATNIKETKDNNSIKNFDKWLITHIQNQQTYDWPRDNSDNSDKLSVCSYVRNAIHHPENKNINAAELIENHLSISIAELVYALENYSNQA